MDHLMGTYSSLLVPALVAVVLIVVVMKVVSAIVKLVALAVLLGVLFFGFQMYGRVSSIQKAIDQLTVQAHGQITSAQRIESTVHTALSQTLQATGLDPSKLHLKAICGSPTEVQVWYSDSGFLFGLLSNQRFTVPLDNKLRCQ